MKYDDPSDLTHFQRFIHHRAYRKLGYRVLDFSERWGTSPIAIIRKNLDPDSLEPSDFTFPNDPNLHTFIRKHVQPKTPSSSGSPIPVYNMDSDNVSNWIDLLEEIWIQLQVEVLDIQVNGKPLGASWDPLKSVTAPQTGPQKGKKRPPRIFYMVKKEPPMNKRVVMIVVLMDILENVLRVFSHLSSSPPVSVALGRAGRIGSPFLVILALIVPQRKPNISRKLKG